jgi:plasmid stability protein
MATLYIRGVPDPLYRRLAKRAKEEQRSLSAEALVLLKRELSQPSTPQREVLSALDQLRFKPAKGEDPPSSIDLLKDDRRR